MAAEAISADPSVAAQVIIDSDTQGVAGEPHVTEELLRKISESEFFAPDLTFVGRTDGGKLLPNPNVLIECGYALRVFRLGRVPTGIPAFAGMTRVSHLSPCFSIRAAIQK
jgi:hypothetical protein